MLSSKVYFLLFWQLSFSALVILFSEILGKWLGSRQIRCNWAAKGAIGAEDKHNSDAKSVVELTNGTSGLFYIIGLTLFFRC